MTDSENLHQPKKTTETDLSSLTKPGLTESKPPATDGHQLLDKVAEADPLINRLLIGFAIFIGLIMIGVAISNNLTSNPDQTDLDPQTTDDLDPDINESADRIQFVDQSIKDQAYVINYQKPTGNKEVAQLASEKIDTEIASFKNQAILDRESYLAEGRDLPTYLQRPYNLDITAEYYSSDDDEYRSVVVISSTYTGGANSNSVYNSYNTGADGQQIDSIEDLIDISDQDEVKTIIINALEAKRFDDSTGKYVLFPESLQNLDLADIDWAIEGDDLLLFFDEYQIGPGALGAIEISVPLSEFKDLIKL